MNHNFRGLIVIGARLLEKLACERKAQAEIEQQTDHRFKRPQFLAEAGQFVVVGSITCMSLTAAVSVLVLHAEHA